MEKEERDGIEFEHVNSTWALPHLSSMYMYVQPQDSGESKQGMGEVHARVSRVKKDICA